MDTFDKLSVSQLVWYLLPGLAGVIIVLFPLAVLSPDLAAKLATSLGALGFAILGMVVGFVLDGLRLYRLRPGYRTIRKEFFAQLQKTLNSDQDPYFLFYEVNTLALTQNNTIYRFSHSIWIMLGQMTFLSWTHGLIWAVVLVAYCIHRFTPNLLGTAVSGGTFVAVCLAVAAVSVVVGLRLLCISIEEQRKTNKIFLEFARANAADIQKALGRRLLAER
jgi:hypothetical protein